MIHAVDAIPYALHVSSPGPAEPIGKSPAPRSWGEGRGGRDAW